MNDSGMKALICLAGVFAMGWFMVKLNNDRLRHLPDEAAHVNAQAAKEFPTPPPPPVMDWKMGLSKTIALTAGSEYTMGGTTPNRMSAKVKASISADSSVYAGFSGCNTEVALIQGETAPCVIGGDWTLSVRDMRDGATLLGSAAGLVARNATATDRISAPNKVKLVLYSWDCIANCAPVR